MDKERSEIWKFEDKELEEIFDEDRSQTLAELGNTLQVDESTVSKRLKVLGMIKKQGHWVPYELEPRDVLLRVNYCFNGKKEKVFCTVSWLEMKRGYTTIIQSVENRGVGPSMHEHRPQTK